MENKQSVENFFYIKLAFIKIKRYWYYFVFSVIGFASVAYTLNWYSQPVYEVGSLILIDEGHGGGNGDPSQEFMKSFSIFTPSSDINKEIKKMKSLELIYQALQRTNSEISYYATVSGVKKMELYHNSPFHVEPFRNHVQPLEVKFRIEPKSENSFILSLKQTDDQVEFYNYEKNIITAGEPFSIDQEYEYGDTIKSDLYCFVVLVDREKLKNFESDAKYNFVFNNLNELKYRYQDELKVEQVGRDIQAVTIKMKVKNPQRGIDFITALTDVYLQRNVEKNNAFAEKTIEYLDYQIAVMQDSLKYTESDLERFRSTHKVMEMGSKSNEAFEGARSLEMQKADLQARAIYYNYINNNLDNKNLLVPSSMGVNDNILSSIIEEYIKMNTERNVLIQSKQTQSPYFNSLTIKINNQKNTISENINNLINTNNLQLASIEERLRRGNAQISALPGIERQLVGKERKSKLNDKIYTYMLEKKAEAEVAKASNLANSDILEPAKLTQLKPVFPNKALNFLVALAAGLFFPFVIFGVRSIMNNTITDEQMLLSLVQLPFIGRVYRKKGQKEISALIDSPKSPILESIRTVRTNIEYFLGGKKNQVILFTSSMSGEGKSFCSLNLANSLALTKRKIVLLDFDLRKPNHYSSFPSESKLGITSFLNGASDLKDIFTPTGIANFDFIGAGEVPSNPAELIDSDYTALLINKLKEEYDYVIIDTAPIGLVWETFLLMKYSDLKIFVVRENVTPKVGLVNLLNELKMKEVENMYCLLNDVDMTDSFYGKTNQYFTKK